MRPDKIMIAVGIFILFMVVGTGFLFSGRGTDEKGGLFVEYDVDADDDNFRNLTQNISGIYDLSRDMQQGVLDEEVQASTGWENMIIGGYKAFELFVGIFGIIGRIIGNLFIILKVPAIFTQIGMAMLLITVVFIIIYMVFRFQPRD